jgi:MFS family permease
MDGARNLALPAWVSLTADIVPLAWRGRYFGNRNLVMGISAMVIILFIGELITRLGTPSGYQWAMGVAFAVGMLSTYYFSRINEPKASETQVSPSRYSIGALRSTLRGDRNFLIFCIYTALWTFSLNIAGPFFSVYLVQTLGATASIVGLTTIVTRISGIPSQRFFGPLADKWGARKLTLVSGFFVPILPILWLFISSPWGVVPINILSGIFWGAYNLATFNLLLEVSPNEQRARYSAMYQIAVATAAAIGAAIGGLIANQWGIRVLFVISGIGRFSSALFFLFGLYRRWPSTVNYPESSEKTLLTEDNSMHQNQINESSKQSNLAEIQNDREITNSEIPTLPPEHVSDED